MVWGFWPSFLLCENWTCQHKPALVLGDFGAPQEIDIFSTSSAHHRCCCCCWWEKPSIFNDADSRGWFSERHQPFRPLCFSLIRGDPSIIQQQKTKRLRGAGSVDKEQGWLWVVSVRIKRIITLCHNLFYKLSFLHLWSVMSILKCPITDFLLTRQKGWNVSQNKAADEAFVAR